MDPMQETIKSYNSFADDFTKRYKSRDYTNNLKPCLDKFISLLKTGEKVLDIGSGAGFDAKYLFDQGFNVVSIDLADKLIDIAREIAPGVDFKIMDMRDMSFPDNSFGGVWASASILHLSKKEALKVLQNIKRILKQKGVFFLALKRGVGEKFTINTEKGNMPGARRFFAYYTKKEVDIILRNLGFEIEDYSVDNNHENSWMRFCTVNNK